MTRPDRIHLDAECANIGAGLILVAVQKKTRMGDSLHSIGADRVIYAPASRQVRAAHRADALYGGVVTHSIDARPGSRVGLKAKGLIARAYVERRGRCFAISKCHREQVHIGG